LYRGIYEFKKGYQPRTNIVKDENGDLLAYSHSTLNRLKNYFCQPLKVHGIKDVRQTQMHSVEPLLPKFSSFNVEITIEKLKMYKLLGVHEINVLRFTDLYSVWNKEELPQQWKESVIVPIYKR
jgi:hypothetical protein